MSEEECKKCISFYKEAFLNRKERINLLEQELSKYKEANKKAIEYIKSNGISRTKYDGNMLIEDSITYDRDEIMKLLKILEEVEDENNKSH